MSAYVSYGLYADGGVIGRNPSELGGTWAWCVVDATGARLDQGIGIVTPQYVGQPVTNNLTELLALVEGLERLPDGWDGTIYSDSRVSLQRIFRAAQLNNVPLWLVGRLQAIQQSGRLAAMRYALLDGHPTKAQLAAGSGKRGNPVSIHNVWCDRACRELAALYQTLMLEGVHHDKTAET